MNIKRIKECCIYVTNLKETKNFYAETLGLSVISIVENRHIFFRAGESVLLCFIAATTLNEEELPPHGAVGSIHFAFEVAKEDFESVFEKIAAAGIYVLHEHKWPNGLRSFYFHDPDKNLVEIIEEGLWD